MPDPVTAVDDDSKRKKRRLFCGKNTKHILNFFTHLILPLSLGIFTVVVTLYQQRIATEQRLEDREVARQQREQDLNISNVQRDQDKINAQMQRAEDELRRKQDLNISDSRRELDLYIAEQKRIADDLNAEKQRNMSQEQRLHELSIERERYDQERAKYRDGLVLSYINEIGQLLKESNGSLSSNPTTAAIARAKTLNVLGQLDPDRRIQLLSFLYHAGQLTVGKTPLNMVSAQLSGIDLSLASHLFSMKNVALVGAFLMNASFAGQDLSQWIFSDARLSGANFSGCNLTKTNFDRATLIKADLSYVTVSLVTFKNADLTEATFYGMNIDNLNFQHSKLERANFTEVKFYGRKSLSIIFNRSNLAWSIFRRADFRETSFFSCNLMGADFSDTRFIESEVIASSLAFASLVNAKLGSTDLYYTNLSYANLSGAECTHSSDLEVALSLFNTVLPNGTLGPPNIPLVRNGYALCNGTVNDGWMVMGGSIIIEPYPDDKHICAFMPHDYDMILPMMSQLIDISRYRDILENGEALALIHARLGDQTVIIINEMTARKQILATHNYKNNFVTPVIFSRTRLRPLTHYLNVTVTFIEEYYASWWFCEYVELEIMPIHHPDIN